MLRQRKRLFILAFGVLLPIGACGTSAIGVDVCNQIEGALCTQASAQSCNGTYGDGSINLSLPPHPDDTNLPACIRFYNVACLHGLVNTSLPGNQLPSQTQINACLKDIADASCLFVAAPQNMDGCDWLIPPDAGPDADADAGDADAADAPTDVSPDMIVVFPDAS
jgi:hypothetical protein